MHTFARRSHRDSGDAVANETDGLVLNGGWRYDLMVWFCDTFLLRGKLREFRRRTADLAQIQPGETVLDVGCGTGTLAMEVQPRVGTTGHVVGIDASTQQIARARAKAARRKVPVDFQIGLIERLPVPDQTFDVVLSTLMMHHLPDDLKRRGLAETARVLKPGGRLVIADFQPPSQRAGQAAGMGAGQISIQDLPALVRDAGFSGVETEEMKLPRSPHLPGPGVGFLAARKG